MQRIWRTPRASGSLPRIAPITAGAAVGVALLSGIVLWACSTDDARPHGPAESGQPTVASPESANRSLVGFTCAEDEEGVWTGTGTLVNSVTRPSDYVVTARVIAPDGTTVGRRSATFSLAASRSTQVELPDLYPASVPGLVCVAEVVRSGAEPR